LAICVSIWLNQALGSTRFSFAVPISADGGGTFPASVGASERVVAPADGDATQLLLCCRVVDLDDAVFALAQQCRPQVQRVQDGGRRVRFARELFERGAELLLQVVMKFQMLTNRMNISESMQWLAKTAMMLTPMPICS
jgi:hypothetical protein